MPQFPDVPTSKQLGMSLVLDQFRTVVAKVGIPQDRLKVLTERMREAASSPAYVKFLEEQWADPKSVLVGAEALNYVRSEIDLLKKLK